MMLKSDNLALPESYFENEDNFSLGLRELLFLATILFIGFCGFTVCVDKIYSVSQDYNEIESITIHDKDLSVAHPEGQNKRYSSYSLSIEN